MDRKYTLTFLNDIILVKLKGFLEVNEKHKGLVLLLENSSKIIWIITLWSTITPKGIVSVGLGLADIVHRNQ